MASGAWFSSLATFVNFPVILPFMASLFLALIILNHYLPLLTANHRHNVPKGSFGFPLLGETPAFLNPHPSTSIGTFLHHHCSRYGKVFRSHLFFSPTVVSCDEELNYFILQNEGKLFECSYPKPIHGILGNVSMLVAVGDTHKRLRNMALSLVNVTKSKPEFLHDVEMSATRILRSWQGKHQVLFCEEARKARRRISSSVKAIIKERRRRRRKEGGRDDDAGKDKVDFLEILIGLDVLSEDEKVSFVLDSLLGGYETTSLLMSMVVHFLAHSPSALSRLKLEHENIRSWKEEGELLSWEDYKKMEFTQYVINEALRCGNIVKFVHRKALKDVKFRDYLIPSGWKVLPVFTAVHLDSSLHPNAPQFDPWRWEKEDQTCKKFTPFGGGSRFCPGSELARVEVSFFLHHLVHNFRWSSEDSDGPLAFPYVEFDKGLLLNLEHCTSHL
ncbi:Cytochrome P450 724B1 [Linum grandiflorum]